MIERWLLWNYRMNNRWIESNNWKIKLSLQQWAKEPKRIKKRDLIKIEGKINILKTL